VFKKIQIFIFILIFFLSAGTVFAALSCSVAASCSSPDIVVLRMTGTTNSHAELPSQSNYSQLVCCGGVSGLANSCTNTFGVALRLSDTTNAHVEENTESTAAYDGNNACLSVSSGTITIGYQNTNCTGFDTTVASISQTPTNAHIGDGSAYIRKICATASSGATTSSGGSGQIIIRDKPKPADEFQEEILETADFNHDGRIDILDLSILLYYSDQSGYGLSVYDLNKDNELDFLDVSILFYYWSPF